MRLFRPKKLTLYDLEHLSQCCAFTGHRPEKVVGYEGKIIVELRKEILKAVDAGYTIFLTGMSRGTDLWAADIIIHLRRYNHNLKLIGIIPYDGFDEKWSVDWKKHYKLVRKELDGLYVASKEYSPNVYQQRNHLLVDHASMVIAVFNGDSGGTFNTIRYAQKKGTTINITEVWTNEKSI